MHALDRIAPYYKAGAALLIALLTGLITGLVQSGLSGTEILTSLVSMLVAGGTVFAVPNKKPDEVPAAPITAEPVR